MKRFRVVVSIVTSLAMASSSGVSVLAQATASLADTQRAVQTASASLSDLVKPAVAAEKTGAGQAARISAVFDEIERADRALPRDAFDPSAVIAATGRDRTALFTWVRDHTAFVPYRGSLRGPVGVLFDRLGNSLDRALLLADLLERAGFEARLANGPLEPDARPKIEAAMSARARPAVPAVPADDVSSRLAPRFGVTEAQMRARFAALRDARARLTAAARARIDRQVVALAAAVPAVKTPAAGPSPIDDHWWVQAEDRGGWIDLDPALPSSKPGDTYAQALTTIAPKDLDVDRRHTLTIRVMAEVWRNRARSEEVLLEHTFAPSEFFGQNISFSNIAIDWPEDQAFLRAPRPNDFLRRTVIDQVEWMPVLRVGKGSVVKQSIDDNGDLHDNTSGDANTMRLGRNVQRMTQRGAGGATDLLGSLPGGPGDAGAAPAKRTGSAAFTSEWIEFALSAPGGAPARARRQIFDLVTPQQRASGGRGPLTDDERLARGLALAGQMDLLPMFSAIPAAYVAHLSAARTLAAKAAVLDLARLAGQPIPRALRDRLGSLEAAPGAVYLLGMERFDWHTGADQVFVDRLNLIAQRHEIRETAGVFVKRETFDFIANGVGVWPRAGADAYRARLAQGIADTVIESALLEPCPPGATGCARGTNTSDVFDAAPQGWTTTAGASAAAVARVPATLRDRVRGDLDAGYTVMMPAAGAPAATWWRIDPRTGETLGMSDAGGGQSYTETIIIVLTAGVAFLNCVPTFREGYEVGTYGELQAAACLAAGAIAGGLAIAAVAGVALGAVGAALALFGDLITINWQGVFG